MMARAGKKFLQLAARQNCFSAATECGMNRCVFPKSNVPRSYNTCIQDLNKLPPSRLIAAQLSKQCIINHKHAKSFNTSCSRFCSQTGIGDTVLSSSDLIEAWFHEVKTFGTLHIHDLPFDVHIYPLNPHEYPEYNKSMVKLFHRGAERGGSPVSSRKLSELGKLCELSVNVKDEGQVMTVTSATPADVHLPVVCVITVPMKFDVDVKSQRGNVLIQGLDNGNINVIMDKGNCCLDSIKTTSVTVDCKSGYINSIKRLLGNISLNAREKGTIKADKLQGDSIQCVTEAGDLNIKAVYARQSQYQSLSGSLHIRDCHGQATVKLGKGNLDIGSLDGGMHAELDTGSADVFITRSDGVNIQTREGNINLRFLENGSSSLDLQAPSIQPDNLLKTNIDSNGKGFVGSETPAVVKASAPQGKIHLKQQDWLSSMKLKFEGSGIQS